MLQNYKKENQLVRLAKNGY